MDMFLGPEFLTVIMFGTLLLGILLGYPLSFVLLGVGISTGFVVIGTRVFGIVLGNALGILTNYTFLAVPLFVFMGFMVEASGVAEKMYKAFEEWLGWLNGGLAVATLILATVMAACVGVVAASVTMIGLIAVPAMLKRNYDKELISGTICAGGSLGILIPPSVMLVIYGPIAGISVGKLFMAAFIPGLMLSALYISYIVIFCTIHPDKAPKNKGNISISRAQKVKMLFTSLIPPVVLILGVLGTIFFGIASPTEASAVGALFSILLVAAYGKLNFDILKDALLKTAKVASMVMLIAIGGKIFTSVFLRIGGGDVVGNIFLNLPFGKWGVFLITMLIVFILGMFIDWIGIVFIVVPLITPIADALGFNALWFAMAIIINLQFSFITPPFALSIFYLRGLARPEWELDTAQIIRGVLPFVFLIAIGMVMICIFPQIITWLPDLFIR